MSSSFSVACLRLWITLEKISLISLCALSLRLFKAKPKKGEAISPLHTTTNEPQTPHGAAVYNIGRLVSLERAAPEAGDGQPAGQQPGRVAEAPIQVSVQLGHLLVHHAADLLPLQAAAGRQNDELGQGLKQV